ncbi:hypothetical protein V8E51_005048 [Hyaloscypha variabilis]
MDASIQKYAYEEIVRLAKGGIPALEPLHKSLHDGTEDLDCKITLIGFEDDNTKPIPGRDPDCKLILTVKNATGGVIGVAFKSIVLSGSTNYGVVIEQDYENGSPTGVPTTGVSITDLSAENVSGIVALGGVN